jgi:hypothetical protein
MLLVDLSTTIMSRCDALGALRRSELLHRIAVIVTAGEPELPKAIPALSEPIQVEEQRLDEGRIVAKLLMHAPHVVVHFPVAGRPQDAPRSSAGVRFRARPVGS